MNIRKIIPRLNGAIHNNPLYNTISVIAIITCCILTYTGILNRTLGTIMVLVIGIYFFVALVANLHWNKNYKYFKCSYFLRYKKCVCINQRVNKKRPMTKCPTKEFTYELSKILKKLPAGTMVYCCTHEILKEHVLENYPNAYVAESYTKKLIKLKKKLKNDRCDECTSQECQLSKKCTQDKNDKTTFYAIHFMV